jgi:hypothetical protein
MPVGISKKKAIKWRRNKVLQLTANGLISTSQLSDKMQVSESTIKRDRRALIRQAREELGSLDQQYLLIYSLSKSSMYRNLEVASSIRDNESLDPNTRLQGVYACNKTLLLISQYIHNANYINIFRQQVDTHIDTETRKAQDETDRQKRMISIGYENQIKAKDRDIEYYKGKLVEQDKELKQYQQLEQPDTIRSDSKQMDNRQPSDNKHSLRYENNLIVCGKCGIKGNTYDFRNSCQ